jgi:hypothetical protein
VLLIYKEPTSNRILQYIDTTVQQVDSVIIDAVSSHIVRNLVKKFLLVMLSQVLDRRDIAEKANI